MVHQLWNRLESRMRRRNVDGEMDDELRFHLEMQIEKHVAAGMSVEEARRVALRDFGGAEQMKEACRDTRHTWLDSVWQDVRYAVRTFRRNPAFTVVAILTLTLGIGVNAAIFTLVDGVLFRPLPYDDPGRLVWFMGYSARSGGVYSVIPQPVADEIRARHRGVERVSCSDINGPAFTLPGGTEKRTLRSTEVCPNLLETLGVRPTAGRWFADGEGDPGTGNVAILTHAAWQKYFGSDWNVVGRTIAFQERPVRIIGILPPTFVLAPMIWFEQPNLLVASAPSRDAAIRRRSGTIAVGRLRPSVSIAQAQAELNSLDRGLQLAEGAREVEQRFRIMPLQAGMFNLVRRLSFLLLGAAGLVLLLAAVNLANLLMARGSWRERELAIRRALGASRQRLMRQLLLEGMLLCAIGGLAGVIVAHASFGALYALVPAKEFKVLPAGVDLRVLLFTAFISTLSGIVAGALPSFRLTKPDLAGSLTANRGTAPARGARRVRGGVLMAAEMALTVILLSGAGLMINSLVRALTLDLGMRTDGVVSVNVLPPGATSRNPAARAAFYAQAIDIVKAIPGVRAVAGVGSLTVGGFRAPWAPMLFDVPHERSGRRYYVTSEYFNVLGIPVRRGRAFTQAEIDTAAHVAIVSEKAASQLWPGTNAVGQFFQTGKEPPRLVVGIVGDTRDAYKQPTDAALYLPVDSTAPWLDLVVLAGGDQTGIQKQIRERLESALHPGALGTDSLPEELRRTTADVRFQASMLSLFAFLALALSAVGIYGIVGYAVSRRRREMGIRVALGATRWELTSLIVGQSLVPVVIGTAIGLGAAFGLTRLITAMLFEVKASDPINFAAAVAVLLLVAAVAAYGPARRAGGVNPVEALRAE